MIRRYLTVVLLIGLAACVWPQLARAQETQLIAAAKLMEKREYAAAIDKIGAAFKAGRMDNAGTAKGFLMRGECHAKLDKPAQALSDFNNAIWLQSLSSKDRAKAVAGRKRALDSLGLAENSSDAGQSGETTASSSSSSGSGNFFSRLFGSSSSSSSSPPAARNAAPSSGWTAAPAQNTRTAAAPAAGPAPAQAAAATAASSDTKQYTILLATVQSEETALWEAKRLTSRLASLLEGKTAEVRQLENSQSGMYRVLATPFEGKDHARQVCANMKEEGVNCLVVTAH